MVEQAVQHNVFGERLEQAPTTQHERFMQLGNLHGWDVMIEILSTQINEYKRGKNWPERWATCEAEDRLKREMRRNNGVIIKP